MREEWIVDKQKIVLNDCVAEMDSLNEKSIDVVVTSPPYNLDIKYNTYDDKLKSEDYWQWMSVVIKSIQRILKDDGSFFLNVGGTCIRPYIPFEMMNLCKSSGLTLQNNIIWVKSIAIRNDSYGHFKPVPGKRFLNNQHESIFHFTKQGNVTIDRLAIGVPYADKSNIGRYAEQDLRCRGNTWFIPYKTTQTKKQHPAGFPVDLPINCIKLHGIKNDMLVLDPFLGAGTTLSACQQLGVAGTGIDLDITYCEMSLESLKG